ncbi:MAG: putative baseplate assembly protein [Desulfatitalea sp.]
MIDYTAKDYTSLRQSMLTLAREKLPAWTDHSANDLGVVLVELFAHLGDSLFYYLDRLVNESYLATAVERRSVMHLLRLIGYELRPPQPASADLTLLFAADAVGTVTIAPSTAFATTAQATGEAIGFHYIREAITIDLDALAVVSHTDGKPYKRYTTLPVVQVDGSVSAEVIGSSTGMAAQRLALARAPLIESALVVTVDEGTGPKAWKKQSTLLNSTPGDEHYIVRRDENDGAWIEFGDGQYGKIPRRGSDNLRAAYRVGGGAKGNVAAMTISKAVTAVASLEGVFNAAPAVGGTDAEAIADAAVRGPQLFRTMGRAVTARDYETQAMRFGVGKARARSGGWNRIELFVAPAGGGQPTDTLKEDLRAYFEDKRMLTAVLDVRDPAYINVFIEGQLEVEAYFFAEQVQQRVQDAVRRLLAFDNVTFEDKLFISKVYEAIEAIEGVKGVNISRFARADSTGALPEGGSLVFGWSEIPQAGYAAGIQVTVSGGRSDSAI